MTLSLEELTAALTRLQQRVEALEAELASLRGRDLSPSTQLARRNAVRLAEEVRRRRETTPEPEEDTDIDLLIDRLHDLALENGPSSGSR
ncbi:MAG: hypothetical protein ACO3JW_11390 [Vulcanococcus sp.]